MNWERDRWGTVESREKRALNLSNYGITERQARFLLTVLETSGVFVERQYCAFAGIVHGQKTHDFIGRLQRLKLAREIRPGALHRGRLYHVHHKSLYAAIEQPDNRNRRRAPIARMVERLMLLDAVLDDRQYVWMTTERDKLRYFTLRLADRMPARELLPHMSFGQGRDRTVRFFPDKLPIGIEPSGYEHVFVYLLTKPTTQDFRAFLIRHNSLLPMLHRWTIRVLVPKRFAKARRLYERALREEYTRSITLTASHELEWYFKQLRTAEETSVRPTDTRFLDARYQFGGPHFRLLYRIWKQCGNDVIWNLLVSHVRDQMERGEGRLEFVVLPRQYLHLSHLVGVA